MSEVALFSHEAGRHFNLNLGNYCSLHDDEAVVFFCFFLFYLDIVNKMRQVWSTISEFTHNIKQPCERRNIMFMWQFTAPCFQIFYWKMWKTVVQTSNHSLTGLEAAQKKFYQFIISLLLMREMKIRFVSFSLFQFIFENFDWAREVYPW